MESADEIFFGELLARFRKRQGLTQQELAHRIAANRNTISFWERGMYKPETVTMLHELARVLDLDEEEKRLLFEAHMGTASILPLYHLPTQRNPYFTGRQEVLCTLHKKLKTGKQVALNQAISGLGGIGKTQVALEYAYRYREHYHDILWVSAETHETLMASYAEVTRSLRLRERDEPNQAKVVEAVKRWLREHKDWLLVLDNLEDLSLLTYLLPVAHQGAVLLTTRRQVTEPVAQAVELDVLSQEEGTFFLLRRTKRLGLHASLEEVQASEISVARAITQHLGELPLALDQAGAYILETGCELAVYLTLCHQRQYELLERRGSIPTEHPASVTTTLTLAFERVQQQNRAAMELLTLCAFLAPDDIAEEFFLRGGNVLEPCLQPVVADALVFHAAIEVLRSWSLVQRHPQTRALSLHRLVQAILQERLPEPERQQWQQRAIHLLHAVFPQPAHHTGKLCARLLPHVLICATNTSEHIEDLQLAGLLFFAAIHLREEAHYEQAEPLLQRVLHIRERVLGSHHPEVAAALCALAVLYRLAGNFAQARSLFERALCIWEQVGGPRHREVGYTLHGLGLLYWQQGHLEQAQCAFERTLSILEESFGPQHPEVAHPLSNLGLLYSQQGHFEQARPLLERALFIREQALGSEHLEVAYSLSALGQLSLALGQLEQAHSWLERALRIWEEAFGPQHPEVAMTQSHLGQLCARQGQFEQADDFLRRALYAWEQTVGSEHPYVANALNELANLSREQGHFEQAAALYQRALALREQLGREHPDLAESLHDLACLHDLQQHTAEALSCYQQALAIRQQVLGAEHPKTQETRSATTILLQRMARDQHRHEDSSLAERSAAKRVGNSAGSNGEWCGNKFVMPPCPHCHSNTAVGKNGTNRSGTRRFRCRSCSCSFTPDLHPQGHDLSLKKLAAVLKAQGNSNRGIARTLGVDHHTVRRWLQTAWTEHRTKG